MPLPPEAHSTDDARVRDEARAAKHALVREVKHLIELTAHVDAPETDLSEIAAATSAVGEICERLAQLPSLHAKGGLGSASGNDGALLERSGISGRSNPLAAPVQWELHADRAIGWAVYSPAYGGPSGQVHGGFVAAAFDDLLGSAQALSGASGPTGTLTVKMLRPTPLNKRIDYEAGVDRVDGRKIYVWGTAACDGERLAEADIVFIAPKDARQPR